MRVVPQSIAIKGRGLNVLFLSVVIITVVVLTIIFLDRIVKATPTSLSPNDVVIITANSDSGWSATACTDSAPGGPNSNAIDLLLRKDIGAGTQIKVTDNAWTGSAFTTTEGIITYTSATDMPAGTVIRYSDCLYQQGGSGWTRSAPTANFDAAVGGDTLLVYQGSESSPDFIFGFGFRSNSWITTGVPTSNNSYIPTALLSPVAYVTMAAPIARNFQYTTGGLGVYADNFLTQLQTVSNWNRTGTSGVSGTAFGPFPVLFDAVRPSFNKAVRQVPVGPATNASSVIFRITTSEPVQLLDVSDFTVLVTGTVTYGSVVATAIDASTYDVIVSDIMGDGTITLDAFIGALLDIHGNPADTLGFSSEIYTIDTTAPTATVSTYETSQVSPALTGMIDDSTATAVVTVNGNDYVVNVTGSVWTLPAGAISPALAGGTYDVTITATDTLGNVSVYTAIDGLRITVASSGTDDTNIVGNDDGTTEDTDNVTVDAGNLAEDGSTIGAPDTGNMSQGLALPLSIGLMGLLSIVIMRLLMKRHA